MENWDEIRTAYHVARVGTVSGAAEVLGVHHATVIRHIDALERRLGVRLFQRHPRGYTPTEAGEDLMRVAQEANDRFGQMAGRIKGSASDVSGDLVVTSLGVLSHFLVPALAEFQQANPNLALRYLTAERLFRLEYGEAHVAIRAGGAPDQPDNVAQPFFDLGAALYASEGYIARHGRPAELDQLGDHRLVCVDSQPPRAPHARWLAKAVPVPRAVFRSDDDDAQWRAICAGAGIGFVPCLHAREMPGLVQLFAPRPEWSAPLWLVTHMDLHRTAKVQALLTFLKARAAQWQDT
ncbi:LysR family transcriptional regulator [Pelagivirga sediminicola]|uniref:LysR family transcriptional regulator n=1 Tax=Pelagivirga sediminicola TaxID=2170575 RepID=A0A2T7G6V8_9RHOB|nr:LysR family transcriptional regulator [Pelagivirga sediminicola]PVA10143.1 LysR family transcriptional regulator [Pelagivirga sediminicola]